MSIALPQIDVSQNNVRRSVSDHRFSEKRRIKTLGTERQMHGPKDMIVHSKLKLGKHRNTLGKKAATQLNQQLEKHYHKEELKKQNEVYSSDQQKEIYVGLTNTDNQEPNIKSVKMSSGRLRSLHTERTLTVENEPLVGKDAVHRFYNVHKDLDKIQSVERLTGKISAITLILRLLEDLHIPPKKLEFIKESGNRNILDLRNCGLGRGNNATLLNEILEKIGDFEILDISHNSIHLDVVDKIIPWLGNLRYIDLSHNKINKDGCKLLSQLFLQKTTRIDRLQIESNQLSDFAGVELFRYLPVYHKLRILNLSKNFLSKDSAIGLSKILTDPHQILTELYLHWNQIHQQGSAPLFEAMSKNTSVKVLDISWNYQRQPTRMLPALRKFLETNKSCVHVDLSYCNFRHQDTKLIKKSLALNNTIYGFHFQGNHGHIDSRGNLILQDKNSRLSQIVQYPMPLYKSVTRRIRGVEKCVDQQRYGMDQRKNICWICLDYQEFEFRLPKPFGMSGAQCFVHLDRQMFRGFKLLERDNEFFIRKMIPKGYHRFFFTLSRDYRVTSQHYDKTKEGVFLEQYKIGRVKFLNIAIPQLNIINITSNIPVIDAVDYTSNVECRPRQTVNKINLKNLVLRKRLIQRLEKMKFSLKELPQVTEFRPTENQFNDVYKKCIDYDLENSKITNVLPPQKIEVIKQILLRYYKQIWCAFDYLSCENASEDGFYSISQQCIISFANEVRYVTKRLPLTKIVLKYVTSLRKDGTMRRSQFVEFLIRVADEKWAKQDKTYYKSIFHQANLSLQKLESRRSIRKGSISKQSQRKNSISKQSQPRKDQFRIDLIRQQSGLNDDHMTLNSEDESQQVCRSIGKRQREALPIEQALDRILKPLINYYHKYTPESWRKNRYMTPDTRLLLDAYQSFISRLFDKYAKAKVYNKRKVISFYDFVSMFLKAGVVALRSKFSEGQRSFIMSRILEPNDSQPLSIGYDQMNEAVARVADILSLPPIGFSGRDIFRSEKHRMEIPLVFKLESLLCLLYKGHPQLATVKLTSLFEDGIFRDEIETYIEIATQNYMTETSFMLQPRINTKIKFNNLNRLSQLTLKDLIEALRLKYSNMMIRKYSVVEQLQQDDEDDEQPQD